MTPRRVDATVVVPGSSGLPVWARALLASEGKRFERAAIELPAPGVEPPAFCAAIDDGDDQPLGAVVDRRAS